MERLWVGVPECRRSHRSRNSDAGGGASQSVAVATDDDWTVFTPPLEAQTTLPTWFEIRGQPTRIWFFGSGCDERRGAAGEPEWLAAFEVVDLGEEVVFPARRLVLDRPGAEHQLGELERLLRR